MVFMAHVHRGTGHWQVAADGHPRGPSFPVGAFMTLKRILAVVALCAVAAGQALASSSGMVISQVYGGAAFGVVDVGATLAG